MERNIRFMLVGTCNEAKRGFDVSEKQSLQGKKQDFIIHL